MRKNYIVSLPICLLALSGVLTALFVWSTTIVVIQFLCSVGIGLTFLKNFNFLKRMRSEGRTLLHWFLLYGCAVAAHSAFVARSYEQWSYVVNVFLPFILLPCFAIIGSNLALLIKVLRLLLRINLPLSFLFLISGPGDKLQNTFYFSYVSAANLYLMVLPIIKAKWKFLILAVTLMGLFWDFENRSNFLNIVFAFLVFVFYLLSRSFLSKSLFRRILNSSRIFLIFLPIVFVLLGATSQFNIFEYIEDSSKVSSIELTNESGRYVGTDSRTGIYQDARNYLVSSGNWLFGGSAAVKYSTHLALSNADYDAGRLGSSESGVLGLVLFGGLCYAVLFFMLCYFSSKIAISQSKNRLVKLIGIFVAYKWFFAFIESPLGLTFSWVVLFLAIGMTFNRELRELSDTDIERIFRSL